MLTLLLLLQLGSLPNPALTPGAVRPLTKEQICSTRWGKDHRFVTMAMKKQVAAAYGLSWSERRTVEFDHTIPRELGGADPRELGGGVYDVSNLWPEPWNVVVDGFQMGAHQKDRAENAAHRAVCRGEMGLAAAQAQMALDWTVLYRRFVGEFPKAP